MMRAVVLHEFEGPEILRTRTVPTGGRLTAYSGDASGLSADIPQGHPDAIADCRIRAPRALVRHSLSGVVDAHRTMNEGGAGAEQMIRVLHGDADEDGSLR
ncbi:hypothetical protein M3T53_01615 [Actinomyces sp. B33]|uniref:hypothetical protein n=1 Tax=Actinomyces sp. B33 TaxID=2942131 RepID=UPI00234072F2|nr:hypothetical protein [Actinomyces sp. B33]MDC4232413.1 hypothetical protein [Actinomyces sp. B33]